jgi:hypothetical protein
MVKKIHIKSDSKLAIILKKMIEDKIIISKYLKNGGQLIDLNDKVGIKFT